MNIDIEKERADFEAWAQNSFELHRNSAGEYSSNFAQTAWWAWGARAAIEADRSRGEPVGYVSPAAIKRLKAGGNAIVGEMKQGFDVPLYAAPQPAEPIVSDVEAIVRLLERREWADHVATTPLGQRLETAVTVLVGADPQPSEPVEVPSDAVSVAGMPEFDALMDHIYENGTASEGVLPLANAFARAILARYGQHAEQVEGAQ